MRILIFSDLHANLEGLLALQQAEKKPDALLFLGDAVGYGPDPTACVEWLRQNVTFAVQGDHDRAAGSGAECESPVDWRALAEATCAVARTTLPSADRDYLAALPPTRTVELGGVRFCLNHRVADEASALTASEQIWQPRLDSSRADILLFGHTHVPLLRRVGKSWVVNPGSLGQPRHGLPSITYAVWNDGDLRIQHIDYDPRRTIQKLGLLPLDPDDLLRLRQALERGI